METTTKSLMSAKRHLSEQEKRIEEQQELINLLTSEGKLKRERKAREALAQMHRAASRLRREIDALEAHEVVRKRVQANRVSA